MAVSSSVLIAAPPKETPFLMKNGRVSDPWLAWLQSISATGIIVQNLQQLQTVAEDNSTDGNNGTVAAELLDAMALSAEPARRAAAEPDDFVFVNTPRLEDPFDATLPPRSWQQEVDELRALVTAGDIAIPYASFLQTANNLGDVPTPAAALSNLVGAWQSWTPTLTAGTMTISATVVDAQYLVIGSICFFKVRLSPVALSGTASSDIQATLPLPVVGSNSLADCAIFNGSSYSSGFAYCTATGNYVDVAQQAAAPFTLNSTTKILISGSYRIS